MAEIRGCSGPLKSSPELRCLREGEEGAGGEGRDDDDDEDDEDDDNDDDDDGNDGDGDDGDGDDDDDDDDDGMAAAAAVMAAAIGALVLVRRRAGMRKKKVVTMRMTAEVNIKEREICQGRNATLLVGMKNGHGKIVLKIEGIELATPLLAVFPTQLLTETAGTVHLLPSQETNRLLRRKKRRRITASRLKFLQMQQGVKQIIQAHRKF